MGAVDLDVGHGNQLRKGPARQSSIRIKSIWRRPDDRGGAAAHICLNEILRRIRARIILSDHPNQIARHIRMQRQIIQFIDEFGSPGWIRTSDHPINSRMLYR
ncbi:hypothetical protein S23_37120 [Bradyrhizobium cosmicum]|uniref:Uncharacterized protein n=1 Tax=Bradyrhizobium cosmicum TaxID=1404864 RepID=A0AAI8MEJ4_9BRAD|nr:hypothetical protein S23_37120 [Bradyrhizobium cosmicum]